MKEKFLNDSINLITRYNNTYTEDDIDKIKYGLEGLYLTVTKLIIIVLISIILGIFKELILVLIFFNLTFIMINTTLPMTNRIVISILCFIDYLLFAPADTIKRPLTNAKKRKYRKIASCIVALIYIALIFIIKDRLLSNIILTALVIEGILINPYMYKLLGMPYDNYKKSV